MRQTVFWILETCLRINFEESELNKRGLELNNRPLWDFSLSQRVPKLYQTENSTPVSGQINNSLPPLINSLSSKLIHSLHCRIHLSNYESKKITMPNAWISMAEGRPYYPQKKDSIEERVNLNNLQGKSVICFRLWANIFGGIFIPPKYKIMFVFGLKIFWFSQTS